ncbi:MAG: sulfatase-like hydrolase/transferase [Sphingomonadales bacterium]|nr:sulfatase-like hydrolase/transferase [Sphingomonadales bacterium]
MSLMQNGGVFGNWLLTWVVMTNIGFAALWFVGAPPRFFDIMVAGFLGLIVKRFPFWLRYISFAGFMVWTVLKFIGGLFSLTMSSLLYSIQFFLELKPENSAEYIGVGVVILIILGLAYRVIRRDQNFANPWMIIGGAAAFISLAAIDIQMGKDMRGHYFRTAPEGAVFGSASSKSGFAKATDGKRHLMLVVVESLGVPHDNAEMNRLLFAHYKESGAVQSRYTLSQGTTPFYNSTTSGEVRELCGRWGDYYDLLDKKDAGCLPARLAQKGYATEAVHSFVGSFFKRETWYPNIGFEKRSFADDLKGKGARPCGGVFPGACDRDVVKILGDKLRKAEKPTFLYWLTLNSHLPVPPGLNLNVDKCERVSAKLAAQFPQICRQFAIWNDIDVAMVKEITAKDFPATDILIVGDHMPPFFDKHQRTQFDAESVPWLYLRHRDSAGTQ